MSDKIDLLEKPSIQYEKDAVHIAVIAVIAGEDLSAGTQVAKGANEHYFKSTKSVGIVNPFSGRVKKGDLFWLMLNPNTITGMRHNWTHPDFNELPNNYVKIGVQQVINKFADYLNLDFNDLISIAQNYLNNDRYEYDNSENYKDLDWSEFWQAYNILFPNEVITDNFAPFTCSC